MKGKSRTFRVEILEHLCKGCGLCVEVCAAGKLDLRSTPNKQGVQPAVVGGGSDCTGCGNCATICPDGAVEITYVDKAEEVASPQN
jgi:2-oxoglutarate ferredoxin oxidoreductase subunit delta